MADIKKFKFWAQKVLPLVYDDSLSYYEVLCKVVEYLNEVIEVCNTFDTDVEELQTNVAQLQTITSQLQSDMEQFNTRFTQLEASLTARIDNSIAASTAQLTALINGEIARLDAQVNAALAEVREVVASLDEHIDAEVAAMKAEIEAELARIQETLDNYDEYIAQQFQLLQKYIDDEFEELKKEIPEFENVMVVNPHTATLENIQKVINELYDLDRSDALDTKSFDSLGLTCGELDKYIVEFIPRGLTAIEWDYRSANIFADILNRVPSLVGNGMVLPKFNEMVLEKCVKQGGSYTAGEWDNLGKDCEALDGFGISCYNIDWRSNTLVA